MLILPKILFTGEEGLKFLPLSPAMQVLFFVTKILVFLDLQGINYKKAVI